MPTALSDLTAQLLAAATAAGADSADALAVRATQIQVGVRGGRLEEAERSEGIDLGLRVLVGRRQASVSSSDERPATLARMAERAVAMAREAPEDAHAGLADPGQLSDVRDAEGLQLFDPGEEPDPARLEEAARTAEEAARAVPGVTQIDAAGASWSGREMHLAATNGFAGGYRRTERGLSCVAISGSGTRMERDWDYDSRVFSEDLRAPEDIGRVAGERAAAMEGTRKARTGTWPVLYDERVAGGLVGHLVQAINGQAIARGSSWLRNAMGERVLPEGIDLVEDPHRVRVAGSRPFDAEGLRTGRRVLVGDGVLQSWTLDLATARKLGLESTANAARGTGGPPAPSVTNLELTQGAQSREELVAGMGTGLLVTSLIGSTINPNTGDYSRGASGFWIEKGEIAHPVSEVTIAGNLRDMLGRIVPANDARPWVGRVVPSILIDGMTLAGE